MNIIEPDQLYKYNDIINKSICLAEVYKNILKLETIGISHDNRNIIMLKLGRCKKNILITAGVHGREYVNSAVLLRIIENYCSLMTLGKLDFKDCGVIFVPVLNPDGYVIATEGFKGIKDKKLRCYCKSMNEKSFMWKWNARAIDINRNFISSMYEKKAHTGDVNSENETKAFITLVQYEDTIGYLDIHSRGNVIYYYRNAMGKDYNTTQKNIARRLAEITGYNIMPPSLEIDSNDTGGNTVHYYSEYINKPALTLETIDDNAAFPLSYTYAGHVYYQIRYVPLEFLQLCRYNASC